MQVPPVLDLRQSPKAQDIELEQTFVVLASSVTLLYRWGNGNTRPWHIPEEEHAEREGGEEGVIDLAHRLHAEGATAPTDIVLARGKVFLDARPGHEKWSGVRTRYTPWVHATVRELLRRHLIRPRTPVLLGNWASLEGEFLGTARALARRPELPASIVLFHGTASDRLADIWQRGLRPQSQEHRVWRGERRPAPHRDFAIYLSADRPQAFYYAERAVRVARRSGKKGTHPVLLSVRLRRRAYGKLRADDDWLNLRRQWGMPADPADWFHSLVEFGQVAFVGSISPRVITIIPEEWRRGE